MARDVELDIIASDQTGRATRSAGNNFDRLKRKVDGVNGASAKASGGVTGLVASVGKLGSVSLSNPYVAITLLTAALLALPVAAVAAAGALVTALGGGLAALGVLIASKSAQVRKAFGDTTAHIQREAPKLARAFEPVLVNIARRVRETFDFFAPTLQASFNKMAPAIDRFAGNFQKAFYQLQPAIAAVTDAFIRVLDEVGPQLPAMFSQISASVVILSRLVSANAKEFATLARFLAFVTAALITLTAAFAAVGTIMIRAVTPAVKTVANLWQNLVRVFLGGVSSILGAAAKAASAIGMDGAAKKLRGAAAEIDGINKKIQASINALTGKTITVTTRYVERGRRPPNTPQAGFGGAGLYLDAANSWSAATSGSFRTGGPAPVVNVGDTHVDARVFLDSQVIAAVARTVVRDELSAQARRNRVGRAR